MTSERPEVTSRVSGFYKRPLEERLAYLIESGLLREDGGAYLRAGGGLAVEVADRMSENVVATHGLPLGVALNFRINHRDVLVPMAVEEPSVVAAASNAARLVRVSGGFFAGASEPVMTTQVQLDGVPEPELAAARVIEAREALLRAGDAAIPGMVARGGGCRDLLHWGHAPTQHRVPDLRGIVRRLASPSRHHDVFVLRWGVSPMQRGASEGPWAGFGDGVFLLPRWSWVGGELTFAVDAADRAVAELEALGAGGAVPNRPLPRVVRVEHSAPAAWRAALEAVRSEIAAGTLSKVVLARRSVAELDGPADPAAVLSRLAERFADCTCFGFGFGESAFVGATPERLFRKRGRHVRTEALAGSIDARRPGAAESLLASAKDREEHALVAGDVARRLGPLCDALEVAERPEVRALRHVLHMRTPIEGRVRGGVHPVDLLAALHPTPAVGGVPADAALDRIRRLELVSRGWYSGPVGWLDARGDADFAVALRSGLLHGSRTWVYAGAGIVRDSDPAAEWEETALKMRAVLEALGVRP